MNAVTAFLKTSRLTSRIATLPLYETARSFTWKTASRFVTPASPCSFAISARLIGSIVVLVSVDMVTMFFGSGCG